MGSVDARDKPNKKKRCPKCKGDGKIDGKTCRNCKGKGYTWT